MSPQSKIKTIIIIISIAIATLSIVMIIYKMKNKKPPLEKWSANATSTTNKQWYRNGGRRKTPENRLKFQTKIREKRRKK